jgi:periplasmic mercuric ion binding protein
MKSLFASLLAASTMLVSAQAADVTTTLSDVHMCCAKCVKGAEAAVAGIPNLKATASQEGSDVVLTAPDVATLQKGTDALTKAGFFGKSSNADIKVDASTGAKGAKVQTLTVSDVHLCCAKCVKGVDTALKNVPGYTTNNATVNGKTFVVTGNFSDTDIFNALQKAGFTGKVSP